MAGFVQAVKRHYRPHIDSLKADYVNAKDKDYFRPSGTQIFVGKQGSGKTVSAVKVTATIANRYPKAIICSNLQLTKLSPLTIREYLELQAQNTMFQPTKQYILFSTAQELELALTLVNNDKYGVIYLIDEIHTYFNSKDSKEMPIWVFQQISQQRKQRKCIMGTSQLFMRVSKPFREQCDNIVFCRTIGGVLTLQTVVDGETFSLDYDGRMSGVIRKRGFFVHNEDIRKFYDTYQVINSGSNMEFEQLTKPEKQKPFQKLGLNRNRTS